MKGTYILLIELRKNIELGVGALGEVKFRKGFYAYVGSGMNSLEKRIGRHLKKRKKKFWHIDYFLAKAKIVKVVFWEGKKKDECEVAGMLAQQFESVKGFGCSDCECRSHLFYSEKSGILEAALEISRSFPAPRLPLPSPRLSVSST